MRSRLSGPLPPLPPVPTKPELKRITNLVNKALTSTSLKEKNDLLQEMRVIWIPQNEELEAINASNQTKQHEYDSYHEKMEQYQKDHENLRVNTSFFYKAQNVREKRNEAVLTRSINNTEMEIDKISSLSSPQRLQKTNELSNNPDKHLFTLLDLNLSRLEELAYAYKKRLLVVEQSQESTDLILKEFKSVYGLLDREKELANENERLKNSEKAFINDAFARRRKFAEMSPNAIRTMATVFSTEIEDQNFILENYENAQFEVNREEDSTLSFEDVCRDKGFKMEPNDFDSSEFTANDEITDRLLQADNARDRLTTLRELIDQLSTNNDRLSAEIEACRQKKRRGNDPPTNRIEKFFDENDQLFERIAIEQDKLDKRTKEGEEIAKDVLTTIKCRSGYKQNFIDLYSQFRDLSKSQSEITTQLYRDKKVLGSLLYVASSFGKQLIDNDFEEKTPLAEMLSSSIQSISKVLEDTAPPPPQNVEPPKEEAPEEISIMSMVKGIKKPRRKQRRDSFTSNHSTVSLNNESSESNQAVTQKQKSLMENPTQAELYNALSLALDLGGFAIGQDVRCHEGANHALMQVLNTFSNVSRTNLKEFEKELTENFLNIRICANRLLVKQKENISIQTEAAPRTDEEIQAGESVLVKSSNSRKKL